ncbi:MAG: MscL family protein [Candidatus Kerfeldbacteria bacterium]
MKPFKRFQAFLKEYRIIGISVAFIIGMAGLDLVQSLVNDIILPLLRPLFSARFETWEDIVFQLGSANIRIGSFLSATISLLLIVLFLYLIVERVLHWKPKK